MSRFPSCDFNSQNMLILIRVSVFCPALHSLVLVLESLHGIDVCGVTNMMCTAGARLIQDKRGC